MLSTNYKDDFKEERTDNLIDFKEAIFNEQTKHYEYSGKGYSKSFSKSGILLNKTIGDDWESYYSDGKIKEFETYQNGVLETKGRYDNNGFKHGYWITRNLYEHSISYKGNYKHGYQVAKWDYTIREHERDFFIDYDVPVFKSSIEYNEDTNLEEYFNSESNELEVLGSEYGDLNNDGVDDLAIIALISPDNSISGEYVIGVFLGEKSIDSTIVYLKNTEVRRLYDGTPGYANPRTYYNVSISNGALIIDSGDNGYGPRATGVGYKYSYIYTLLFDNSKFIMTKYKQVINDNISNEDSLYECTYDFQKNIFSDNKGKNIKLSIGRNLLFEDFRFLWSPKILKSPFNNYSTRNR